MIKTTIRLIDHLQHPIYIRLVSAGGASFCLCHRQGLYSYQQSRTKSVISQEPMNDDSRQVNIISRSHQPPSQSCVTCCGYVSRILLWFPFHSIPTYFDKKRHIMIIHLVCAAIAVPFQYRGTTNSFFYSTRKFSTSTSIASHYYIIYSFVHVPFCT